MSNPMILALQNLRENNHYKILVEELERLNNNVESQIFDENIPHEKKLSLIIKRNTIKNFIELPDDLINDELLKE